MTITTVTLMVIQIDKAGLKLVKVDTVVMFWGEIMQ